MNRVNRIFGLFAIGVMALLTTSCSEEKHTQGREWGFTEYYESSLFGEYEPVVMSHSVAFELNQDARELLGNTGRICFEVVGRDANGNDVALEGIKVYVNDELREDNCFELSREQADSVKLGFEFEGTAAEGTHKLYLKSCGYRGVPASDASLYPLNITSNALESGIVLIKYDVRNPGNLVAQFVGLAIIALLLLWILIIRYLVYSRIKGVSRMTLLCKSAGYQAMPKIAGCRRVVLTSKAQKQGFLNRLFTAKIHYEVNPLWTSDIVFVPSSKGQVRMLPNADYICTTPILVKGVNGELKNIATGQTIDITIL